MLSLKTRILTWLEKGYIYPEACQDVFRLSSVSMDVFTQSLACRLCFGLFLAVLSLDEGVMPATIHTTPVIPSNAPDYASGQTRPNPGLLEKVRERLRLGALQPWVRIAHL
jgi:hypothetical protein